VRTTIALAPAIVTFLGTDGVVAWTKMAVDRCVDDHWPQPVIDCVIRTKQVDDECVTLMPHDVESSYSLHEQQWSAIWQPDCHSLNGPERFATNWTVPTELLAPRVDDLPGDLRTFSLTLREHAFSGACDTLGLAARRCFAAAKTVDDVASCRAHLDKTEAATLDERMTATDNLTSELRDVYRHPAALECTAILAQRYSDAAWQGRFRQVPAAARKAMIADSRARLRDLCTKLAKSSRACLVVGTDDTSDALCDAYDPATRGNGSASPELHGLSSLNAPNAPSAHFSASRLMTDEDSTTNTR